MPSADQTKPTPITYGELQDAFDFFNDRLFEGKLPQCILTMQRKKHTYGYFSCERWVNSDGAKVDEIAMNPSYFATRSIKETLSTVVHEMTHLYQYHFGKPSRGRYHNAEWGQIMERVGLMPSNTGEPGGKRTGDQMSHYIIKAGKFDVCCDELLSEDFKISWMDRFAEWVQVKKPSPPSLLDDPNIPLPAMPTAPLGGSPDTRKRLDITIKTKTAPTRAKYECPVCMTRVWGKPGLTILCGVKGTECFGKPLLDVTERDQAKNRDAAKKQND